MTKLKCWKKVGKDKFKGNKLLSIEKLRHLKGLYAVSFLEKDETFRTNTPNTKTFVKKSQALKFANKYMKEHDKC